MIEYSRTLVPLWFNDGNEEFPVRSIEDLKRFWLPAHIEKIIEYFHDGSFERFFFALRKDELTQLIVDLKWKGTPDLEIVNEVGSRLGFEPLATLETERDFIKPTVPLEEVFSQKGELKLLPGEWTAQNLNIVVNKPLTIIGSGNQKTLIHTGNLNINAKDRLIVEDLTFKALRDTGEIRVKEGEVIFKNVHFSGVRLYIEGGKAITEDCLFENLSEAAIEISGEGYWESRVKIDFSNVPPNAQIMVNGIVIHWKKDIALHHDKEDIYTLLLKQEGDLKVLIEKIPDKKAITLPLKSGTYNLDGYTIKNKTLTFKGLGEVNIIGSINIEDSEVTFENIQFEAISAKGSKVVFKNCKGKGIYGKSSQIMINGSEIYGNKGNGINVKENSTLEIKDSKVYENGTAGQYYHQIWVESSKAEISNSLVYNGINGTGIYGKVSQITINSSEIHGNKGNGIVVKENSILTIKDSRVYENGTARDNYPQIWVENSKAEISNSLIYHSKHGPGIYVISGSKVELINVKTWGNSYGLKYNEYGTSVLIENCEFKDGKTGL